MRLLKVLLLLAGAWALSEWAYSCGQEDGRGESMDRVERLEAIVFPSELS